MKSKMMLRYLMTVAITSILIVLISITSIYQLFVKPDFYTKNNEKYQGIDDYVRGFSKNIGFNKDVPYIEQKGKDEIKGRKGWAQILDENGNEVYRYLAPETAPKHYSPIDIVHAYKYTGGIKGYSIFVSAVSSRGHKWTYIIGYPEDYVIKYTLYFNSYQIDQIQNMIHNINYITIFMIVTVVFITMLIGYIFVRKLTRPLFNVMDNIKELSEGNYNTYSIPKGIYSDIYRIVNKLSATLKESTEERKKLDKMREEWIENISHDLKTPLSSIIGYSEILHDNKELPIEERNKYLQVINDKSQYMRELLQDLRITYQIKNDSSILKKEKVNLVDFTAEIIIDILNHPDYQERTINFEPQESVIETSIDTVLFKRALDNLIYNSLKHNPIDTVIDIVLHRTAPAPPITETMVLGGCTGGGNGIIIEISDNGRGMSPDEVEKLFDRYYKGTDSLSNTSNSGLGMAISQNIINAHGGTINVKSAVGKGTCITIEL